MATVRRLYVAPDHVDKAAPCRLPLPEDEVHYARTVLRLGDGDSVILADGLGNEVPATLRALGKRGLEAERTGPFAQAPGLEGAPEVTVAVPLPKGDRADWMVEKLSELAVHRWIWLVTARSGPGAKNARPDRCLRLMRAAARQAEHGRVPLLEGPTPLSALLEAAPQPDVAHYVAHPRAHPPLARPPGPHGRTLVVLGPEGGLTEDELRALEARGYGRLSLGRQILRVETAAMAAALLLSL